MYKGLDDGHITLLCFSSVSVNSVMAYVGQLIQMVGEEWRISQAICLL
jgi:hypothetical protein